MPCIASLNRSRFSAVSIARALAPIISTPYFSSTPRLSNSMARFSAVWPPRVGRSASGRSFTMMDSSTSGSSGSIYVAWAKSGSVMIVAGFELARTTRYPSSLSTRQAWVPE